MALILPKGLRPDLEGSGHWWARAIRATRGRTTARGTFVLAVIGPTTKLPSWLVNGLPRFGESMDILANGNVVSDLTTSDGKLIPKAKICRLDDLKKFAYDLAEKIKMTDAECDEWYQAIHQFTATDQTPGERLETWLRAERNRAILLKDQETRQ